MSHDYRDVLLKAASRVEQEGMWCQGVMWPDQEGFPTSEDIRYAVEIQLPSCLEGAVRIAAFEMRLGDDLMTINSALNAVKKVVGELAHEWNDAPGRTAFEVAEAMRKAAEC